ncbi:MAG: Trm112 family protein [Actinomycetota bacterium]
MIDQELLSLLICPNCKGEIEYLQEQEVIACVGKCRYRYPVVKNIPHMLIAEAIKN